MIFVNLIFFFLLGITLGSFINMMIYRFSKGIAFTGRSFCDHCKKPLTIKDLIPVFSYLYYKGKSRCCKKKLEIYLPIIELITGLVFVSIFYWISRYPDIQISIMSLALPYQYVLLIISLLLAIILIFTFFYDLKFFQIPLYPILAGYVIWIIYTFLKLIFYKQKLIYEVSNGFLGEYLLQTDYVKDYVNLYVTENILYTLYFAVFTFIFFLLLFLGTKGRGMGFGDVYTAPLLALISGFPVGVVYLFSSFIFGAVYGIITIGLSKNSLKSRIPFGPFLIIGLAFSLLFGRVIVSYYLSLL